MPVAATDCYAGAENAQTRKLVGAERTDVVQVLGCLSPQPERKLIREGVAMERGCREIAVVVALDTVFTAQEASVVAVLMQPLGKSGLGGEEEGLLQHLFATEWVANGHRHVVSARNAADAADIQRTRRNIALRNQVSVDSDLHGGRERDLGCECRSRILDEIRVHRVELGEAHTAKRYGVCQVERRGEKVAQSEASQVGPIVVLQVGEQPGETRSRGVS